MKHYQNLIVRKQQTSHVLCLPSSIKTGVIVGPSQRAWEDVIRVARLKPTPLINSLTVRTEVCVTVCFVRGSRPHAINKHQADPVDSLSSLAALSGVLRYCRD